MKIILFGKIRSGKDTVGEMLIENYGFNRLAFGDEIGWIIKRYFPNAFDNGKPRHHYQFIGQQFRQLDADIWIKELLRKAEVLEHMTGKPANIVVTDARQLNEAEKLKEQGYIVVKVVANDEIRIDRMKKAGDNFSPEMLEHETEKQVDLVQPDYVVPNNGTLEDLQENVDLLIEYIKKREVKEHGR